VSFEDRKAGMQQKKDSTRGNIAKGEVTDHKRAKSRWTVKLKTKQREKSPPGSGFQEEHLRDEVQ